MWPITNFWGSNHITGTAEPKVVKFCTRVGYINSDNRMTYHQQKGRRYGHVTVLKFCRLSRCSALRGFVSDSWASCVILSTRSTDSKTIIADESQALRHSVTQLDVKHQIHDVHLRDIKVKLYNLDDRNTCRELANSICLCYKCHLSRMRIVAVVGTILCTVLRYLVCHIPRSPNTHPANEQPFSTNYMKAKVLEIKLQY